jgi:hypothetical protein
MSQLYNVTVTDLSTTIVGLELKIVHPDAGLHVNDDYTTAFALRLLYEPAFELDLEGEDPFATKAAGALGNAFTYEDQLSESWCKEHASEYIESAVMTVPENLPEMPPVGTKAMFKIIVTNPKWLEHLSVGQKWDSAAY